MSKIINDTLIFFTKYLKIIKYLIIIYYLYLLHLLFNDDTFILFLTYIFYSYNECLYIQNLIIF